MNNCPISGSWKAKRQGCMTLSSESAEAEFVAARQCGQEVVYLRNLLAHLGYEQKEVTRVYEDNAACIKMSENAANPCSSRHIDTRVHFILELMPDKVPLTGQASSLGSRDLRLPFQCEKSSFELRPSQGESIKGYVTVRADRT
eukprot:1152380-Rhodomonas_salina.2